ncbi:hypothetical protein ET495_03265 [Xylanimonas allomyrinae]|uniref:Uncharacterized protein n=1 Tax=Xylanimonas allomyrinae TaxID=2509459 RepID=A0A4P6EK23_9MICO|nr:hypothetical protein [Xylanimonas allomyrinae]QAY62436.1 hypothetical protein ET495_03265 [Xylanimonas allomyrinae]
MTGFDLKRLHRFGASAVILVALASTVTHLLGLLSRETLLTLFLGLEAPLIATLLLISLWRIRALRRSTGARGAEILRLLEEEEPALRFAAAEVKTLRCIATLISGRRNGVRPGVSGFGYAKGSMSVPVAMLAITLVEVLIIHLVVPWPWLQIALLIAALYTLILAFGVLASRVANPHLVGDGLLVLKRGNRTVVSTAISHIEDVGRVNDFRYTQPRVDGDVVVLTNLTGTDVRIKFAKPVEALPPVSKKVLPSAYTAREVKLYVAVPDKFVQALGDELRAQQRD